MEICYGWRVSDAEIIIDKQDEFTPYANFYANRPFIYGDLWTVSASVVFAVNRDVHLWSLMETPIRAPHNEEFGEVKSIKSILL